MTDYTQIVLMSTSMITNQLTDDELAAAYLAATSGWAVSPELLGYEKIKPLLTQENNTKMHPMTVEALGQIVDQRLSSLKAGEVPHV